MSVLINMEMPKNCASCPCACEIDGSCHITGYKPTFDEWYEDGVKDCPLVPIPPHGRLIDADALSSPWNWLDDDGYPREQIIDMVNDAPTIIESEVDK